MVSEVDCKRRFLRQLGLNGAYAEPDTPVATVLAWVSDGEVAANGIKTRRRAMLMLGKTRVRSLLTRCVRELHRSVRLPYDPQRFLRSWSERRCISSLRRNRMRNHT